MMSNERQVQSSQESLRLLYRKTNSRNCFVDFNAFPVVFDTRTSAIKQRPSRSQQRLLPAVPPSAAAQWCWEISTYYGKIAFKSVMQPAPLSILSLLYLPQPTHEKDWKGEKIYEKGNKMQQGGISKLNSHTQKQQCHPVLGKLWIPSKCIQIRSN